jgi:hypothetical protein
MSELGEGMDIGESADIDSTEVEGTEASQEEEQDFSDSEEGSEDEGDDSQSEEGEQEEGEGEEEESADDFMGQRFILTVDGQDIEVTGEDLVTDYQLKKASYKRFQEAAEVEKSAKAAIDMLRNDPFSGMKQLGMDEEEIKDHYFTMARKLLEEEKMPEEEKERRKKETRLEELERKEKEREEQERTKAEQQAVEAEMENYNRQFSEALKNQQIPATPHAIGRMAQIMKLALDSKYDMSVKEAAAQYREEQMEVLKHQLGDLPGDQLVSLLGKETADKIRRHDVSKIKNPQPKNPPKQAEQKKKSRTPKQSLQEYLDSLK